LLLRFYISVPAAAARRIKAPVSAGALMRPVDNGDIYGAPMHHNPAVAARHIKAPVSAGALMRPVDYVISLEHRCTISSA
jgi:hypothetical protein